MYVYIYISMSTVKLDEISMLFIPDPQQQYEKHMSFNSATALHPLSNSLTSAALHHYQLSSIILTVRTNIVNYQKPL